MKKILFGFIFGILFLGNGFSQSKEIACPSAGTFLMSSEKLFKNGVGFYNHKNFTDLSNSRLYIASGKGVDFFTNTKKRFSIGTAGQIGIRSKGQLLGDLQISHVSPFIINARNGWYSISCNANGKYTNVGCASNIHWSSKTGCLRFLLAPLGQQNDPIRWREVMTLDKSGKVGIGTHAPAATLDIKQESTPNLLLRESRLNAKLEIGIASDNSNFAVFAKPGDGVIRKLGPSHNLLLYLPNTRNNGSSYITMGDASNGKTLNVFNNGKVTIGTDDPSLDAKLAVKGRILASEIKVSQFSGADFVFEDNYALKPLVQVERFIQENKHLPDVPSAEEMETQGVDLAQMNKLLLQKVEELTLYTLKQDKKLQEHSHLMEKQSQLIQSQQEVIEKLKDLLDL